MRTRDGDYRGSDIQELDDVGVVGGDVIVDNEIAAVAEGETIVVATCAATQRVVATPTGDHVVAGQAVYEVVTTQCVDRVGRQGAGVYVGAFAEFGTQVCGDLGAIPLAAVSEADAVDRCAREVPEDENVFAARPHADDEVVVAACENQIVRKQAVADDQAVGVERGIAIVDCVVATAEPPEIGIGTAAAAQAVVTGTAVEAVVDAGAGQRVVAGRAGEVEASGQQLAVAQCRTVSELETVDRRRLGGAEGVVGVEAFDVDGVVGVAADVDEQRTEAKCEVGGSDAGAEAQRAE